MKGRAEMIDSGVNKSDRISCACVLHILSRLNLTGFIDELDEWHKKSSRMKSNLSFYLND